MTGTNGSLPAGTTLTIQNGGTLTLANPSTASNSAGSVTVATLNFGAIPTDATTLNFGFNGPPKNFVSMAGRHADSAREHRALHQCDDRLDRLPAPRRSTSTTPAPVSDGPVVLIAVPDQRQHHRRQPRDSFVIGTLPRGPRPPRPFTRSSITTELGPELPAGRIFWTAYDASVPAVNNLWADLIERHAESGIAAELESYRVPPPQRRISRAAASVDTVIFDTAHLHSGVNTVNLNVSGMPPCRPTSSRSTAAKAAATLDGHDQRRQLRLLYQQWRLPERRHGLAGGQVGCQPGDRQHWRTPTAAAPPSIAAAPCTSATSAIRTYASTGSLPGPVTDNGSLIFQPAGGTLTVAGTITGGGAVTAATGTTILSGTGNAWGGTTTIASGATLQIGDGATNVGSLPATTVVANAGTLALSPGSSNSLTIGNTINGTGAVSILSGTVTLSGSNATGYSGGTTIAAALS